VGLEALKLSGRKAVTNARAKAGVFILAACVLALSGCASLVPQTVALRDAMPSGLPEKVELTEVPFFPQTEYQCGPAALATALGAFGAKVTPEDLVHEVYLPERKGSLQVEMLAAARRHGMVSYLLQPRFEDLLRELAAGNPVIVLQNLGLREGWHYAVAVGYDYRIGDLILRSGISERETLNFAVHEFVWSRSGYWAMVAMPPDRIPVTADETRWLSAIAALERAGGVRPAATAYGSFLKRWPANVNAAIGLANTHYALGELPQAEAVLREAARREPQSVIVLNNLAQTLADQGKDEEALPFAERAAAAGGPFSEAAQKTREAIAARLAAKRKR
jgi:tetratricopeptide (TPR) repeat protein